MPYHYHAGALTTNHGGNQKRSGIAGQLTAATLAINRPIAVIGKPTLQKA
jgi:hypothetical protein